ncbi:hypothetical protein HD597_011288 [Nonomuraea thailandensis]|uniref:Uncharacterized protein n=1 Tax=Nonomuraea thailandensis TaxID=1188745 RepID=A0A9X2K8L4_9ACTN|nr:hypothetical protein [Nonomuraea thailandensis]MCP2364268.1 hypothetical protein [Nonomuraea thailandensis]
MKVTRVVEGDEISITWEAETPEEMAELKERALAVARGEWPDEVLDEIDVCPMGCGRRTEDAAGGPCRACWDAAPMLP